MSGTIATTHLAAIRDGAKAYASRVKEAQMVADKEAKKAAAESKKVQATAAKEAKKVATEAKKVAAEAKKVQATEAKKVATEAKKVATEAKKAATEAKKAATEAKKAATEAKKVQATEAKKVAAEAKKVQVAADKAAKKVAAEAKKVQVATDKAAKKVAAEAKKVQVAADKAAKKVAAEDEAKKVATDIAAKEEEEVEVEVEVEVAAKKKEEVAAKKEEVAAPATPKKKVKATVAPTPWVGQGNALLCQAIITNHALFTQCTKAPTAGEFCAACDKAFVKKGSHTNGTVADRMAVAANEYVSPTGKKVVGYGKVLATMGISTEDAVAHLAAQGIELADEQFVVPEKAKKGRKPAANKRTDADVGDDIAAIVAHAAKGLQDNSEDDADSLVVDEWTFHGTPYLRDETTNKIYTTAFPHAQVGAYNPDNGSIVRLE